MTKGYIPHGCKEVHTTLMNKKIENATSDEMYKTINTALHHYPTKAKKINFIIWTKTMSYHEKSDGSRKHAIKHMLTDMKKVYSEEINYSELDIREMCELLLKKAKITREQFTNIRKHRGKEQPTEWHLLEAYMKKRLFTKKLSVFFPYISQQKEGNISHSDIIVIEIALK